MCAYAKTGAIAVSVTASQASASFLQAAIRSQPPGGGNARGSREHRRPERNHLHIVPVPFSPAHTLRRSCQRGQLRLIASCFRSNSSRSNEWWSGEARRWVSVYCAMSRRSITPIAMAASRVMVRRAFEPPPWVGSKERSAGNWEETRQRANTPSRLRSNSYINLESATPPASNVAAGRHPSGHANRELVVSDKAGIWFVREPITLERQPSRPGWRYELPSVRIIEGWEAKPESTCGVLLKMHCPRRRFAIDQWPNVNFAMRLLGMRDCRYQPKQATQRKTPRDRQPSGRF